jgi:multiple sugar transport system substrate-binding protein
MTGLERLVSIPPDSHHALRRYLTLFYGFALGLAFTLMLSACGLKALQLPASPTPTLPGNAMQATLPAHFGTQALTKSSPTQLPEVPATPNERTPSPLGVSAAELRGLEVTIWQPWSGAAGAGFQVILDKFNNTNQWGITVTSRSFEGFGSLEDAVEGGLSDNTLPDVLLDYGYQARLWDESGMLADLKPYVDDRVWGLTRDEQADFYPGFWLEDLVTARTQPRRLGIPYYRSAEVLFYNQSWAEELGYPTPPITPEDFRARACAAAEYVARNGDKSSLGQGGWLITHDPGGLAGWIYAFGGNITNPAGTGYAFDTPETRQVLAYLKGLQESGCAWADASLDPRATLASRRALYVVGSLFDIPAEQAAFQQAGSKDEWTVLPFPSSTQPVVDSYGPSLLITRSTPEQQLASWLVVEWLVYPPNQAGLVKLLGAYPTRQTTMNYLGSVGEINAQWAQALALLPDTRSEPSLPSWSVLRWALSDASSQLFSQQFRVDQVPSLLSDLDNLAQEALNQER